MTMRSTPSAARRSANGIPGAGRLLADGEEADQRVELVGKGDGDADGSRRAAIGRALR